MNFLKFLPLLSCVFVFTLGIFVLVKKSPKALKIIFFLFCLVVSMWLFGTFMMFHSTQDQVAIFWDRFIYAGVVFVPPLMHHFSLLITKRKNQKLLLYINYSLAVIFLLLSRTIYFVDGLFYYTWGVHTKAQFFHHLFLLQFFFFIFFLFYNIYTFYKIQANPLEKAQSKYVLLAFGLLIGIGAFAYLPAYGISIFPFSFISGVLFTLVLAYAILRHRFMDIRVVVKNTFIYLSSIIIILTLTFLLWSILNNISTLSNKEKVIIILIFALVSLQPLNKTIEKFSKKFLFFTIYNYQETIRSLSGALIKMIELNKIVDSFIDKIMDIMKLERCGVLLISQENGGKKYKIQKILGFNKENGISLVKDSFLTQYLERLQKPLLLDELGLLANETSNKMEKDNFNRLQQQMKKIEAALCLPLINNNKLTGIIVLGNKLSDSTYTNEDLELLETLSNQMAVAIDNARLYKQVQDFNKTLQAKVDEQTQDIKNKAERLEKLLKMRSEFLDIASHQLRTPVSVINGTLSMMREGDLDNLPKEKQQTFIENTYRKGLKLQEIIDDILSASEMDTIEFTISDFKEISIKEVIEEVIKDKKLEAESKGFKLIFKKPVQPLPSIRVNERYLEQALTNLVDNAIKYTEKGFVEIGATLEKDNLLITVKDTGIGVPKEDLPKLFKKFIRAKNAREAYTDGSGLGLFIVKQIVEAHGGQVWAQSPVPKSKQGSIFYIQLPLKA